MNKKEYRGDEVRENHQLWLWCSMHKCYHLFGTGHGDVPQPPEFSRQNVKAMSDKLNQLKEQIKKQLDLCEASETPTVCAMKNTTEGYGQVERLIIDKVLYGSNTSIADAIVEIEDEYNPNAVE